LFKFYDFHLKTKRIFCQEEAMPGLVADIVLHAADMTGAEVRAIYAKVSTKYAVYGTNDRIMVQFADDDVMGVQQREWFRPLAALRSEIDALMDGWDGGGFRSGKARRLAMAEGFKHRVADALVRALQGDPTSAVAGLGLVRDDLVAERVSIGRLEYLLTALVTALGWIAVLAMVTAAAQGGFKDYIRDHNAYMAACLGVLGSLFSIALDIRNRTMLPDLHRRDNLVDAVLRIGIGAFSAVILFALLKSEVVKMSLGNVDLFPGSAADIAAKSAISVLVAFLAGFSERLVGDFLGSVGKTGLIRSADAPAVPPKAANENGLKSEASAAAPEVTLPEDHAPEVEGELTEDQLTDDSELPPAQGGVEIPKSGNPQ
jgi:hypothetical protein